jgi:hypothetical protein
VGGDVKCLSLYDLTGIQPYIFGSKALQENLGGSFLVDQALDRWLPEATDEAGAEFQWSGGGNAMVAASGPDQAREVATRLSVKLHERAPGLHLACAHADWDETTTAFGKTRRELEKKLNDYKAGRWPPAAFDGAGVTAACASTGEPAVAWEDDRWQGAASQARLHYAAQAQDHIQDIFPLDRNPGVKLTWTKDIDRLGRSRGEQSMIGVIHFDGNGMGKRFRDTQSLKELRDLSDAVKQAGKQTLQAALGWVLENLPGITNRDHGGFLLHESDGPNPAHCFPVRPIVYGGDDITLVCEGRIALDLAAELLCAWRRHTCALPGGVAHACAGVALVRAHYPFYRAYLLAERLCRGAKDHLRKAEMEASALDWEFIAGAGLTTLRQRRDKLYRTATGNALLHARPYYVAGDPPPTAPYRSWDWFRPVLVDALQKQETTHTRFKELAGVLYRGPAHTEIHLRRLRDRFGLHRGRWENDDRRLCLPEPASLALPNGFAYGETPYLDAIELMDRVLPRTCYEGNRRPDAPPEEPE